MSRGTTRRSAFGRRTRTVPNSSRSVTTTRPSGPPGEAGVEAAADEGDGARGGGPRPHRHADRDPGLAEELREAGAWSEARTMRGASSRATRPGDRVAPSAAGAAGRQDRLAPAERVARARGRRRSPRRGPAPSVSSRVRAPSSRRLPLARRQVRVRPGVGKLAGRDEVARAARPPGPTGTRRRRRPRRARRRRGASPAPRGRGRSPGTSDRGPDLGGVARRRARARRPRSPRRRRRAGSGVALEPREVGCKALREPSREAAQPLPDRARPAGRHQELARREELDLSTARIVRWSVGSKTRISSTSSPKSSIRTGRSAPAGKTSTRPPRRAISPRPATSTTGS